MVRIAGYGWIYLEMAGNLLEMARNRWNGWIWLEMTGNCWTWFEIVWPYYSFGDLGSMGYENSGIVNWILSPGLFVMSAWHLPYYRHRGFVSHSLHPGLERQR